MPLNPRRVKTGSRSRAGRRFSLFNLLLLAMVMSIAGWVFWEGQRLIRADAASLKARHLLGQWSSGAASPTSSQQLDTVGEALRQALAITPDDPSLQEQLGDLYMVGGRRDWEDESLRKQHFSDAEAQYRKALALRPTDPQTWASLAAAYQGLGKTGSHMQQAWEKALQLGPSEGHVQPMLLDMVLATWSTASPTMKRWAEMLFESGSSAQRTSINTAAARYGLHFAVTPELPAVVPTPASGAVRQPLIYGDPPEHGGRRTR